MDQVQIFDTTLRDGEQSPGASMDVEQKFEIALQLEHLGVDVIEAGFAVSSPEQFRACKQIGDRVKDSTIAVLARSVEQDIDAAADSLAGAARPRIHTFVSTSPIHMEYKLKKKPDEVIEMTRTRSGTPGTNAVRWSFHRKMPPDRTSTLCAKFWRWRLKKGQRFSTSPIRLATRYLKNTPH